MKTVYQFRAGSPSFPIGAQVAGEALESIGSHNSGELVPEQIVNAARPADSPLHPAFEWDDGIAAERYRKHQARDLIGALVTVIPEQKVSSEPIRAFVSVRREGEGNSYVPIRTAMTDPQLRDQILARAMRELVAWRDRHKELNELAHLFSQVDMFAEQFKD